ncbi:MAG TPA: type II secretion system protein [Labilithrix sp.]|nr:type II secretion system protein [Labilithrix sp.]
MKTTNNRGLSKTWLSRARRAARRGVTLIEILIVLAIVGLIAGGVAVVAVPKYQEAQKKQAQIDARTIHPAAEKYRVDHTGEGCPTVELLRDKNELSKSSKITDPWESPYKIICGDEDVTVLSLGPDKKEGTADDIRIPDTTPAKAQ